MAEPAGGLDTNNEFDETVREKATMTQFHTNQKYLMIIQRAFQAAFENSDVTVILLSTA